MNYGNNDNIKNLSNQKNVAFIPVRGGSKNIPLKNIKDICGKPLVYWVIKAATECDFIDTVYVSTDYDCIYDIVKNFNFDNVVPVKRSKETATDTATTVSAILEFADQYDFDNICTIQATSPLTTCQDLNNGFIEFIKPGVDSVLSCVKQKRFHWAINEDGYAESTNYDYKHRPRRQDFEDYYVENGAFYITSRHALLASKNNISGNIKICEMSPETYYEIDDPIDWLIVESIFKSRRNMSDN